MDQIRSGVALKHVVQQAAASKPAPLRREPSGSIASALRRRLAERKQALDGSALDTADEAGGNDW